MSRHVLICDQNGSEIPVEESEVLVERKLHDVLTRQPKLIPADDLGMEDPLVVFGYESRLGSGFADLVLLGRSARLCLVEFKRSTASTREVVAQLLGYASRLWQMPADDFRRAVFHKCLSSPTYRSLKEQVAKPDVPDITDLPDITSFAAKEFGVIAESGGDDPGDEQFEDFSSDLEQTLMTGRFRLVVAAPDIDSDLDLQQVIEYLNSQEMQIFGLEVNFFKGPSASCYVPRLVVKPSVKENQKRAKAVISEVDFLQSLPEEWVRSRVTEFLPAIREAGATTKFHSRGPSIIASRRQAVAWLDEKSVRIAVHETSGNPPAPFKRAYEKTDKLGGRRGLGTFNGISEDWYWEAPYGDLREDGLAAAFQIALDLVGELEPTAGAEPRLPPSE